MGNNSRDCFCPVTFQIKPPRLGCVKSITGATEAGLESLPADLWPPPSHSWNPLPAPRKPFPGFPSIALGFYMHLDSAPLFSILSPSPYFGALLICWDFCSSFLDLSESILQAPEIQRCPQVRIECPSSRQSPVSSVHQAGP